jgi:hypothetical protein
LVFIENLNKVPALSFGNPGVLAHVWGDLDGVSNAKDYCSQRPVLDIEQLKVFYVVHDLEELEECPQQG